MSEAIARPSRTHQWKRRLIRRIPRSSISSLAYLRRSAWPWSVNSQPMCAWNRPLSAPIQPSPNWTCGECGSPSSSACAWCLRWSATQSMTGPCTDIDPAIAKPYSIGL